MARTKQTARKSTGGLAPRSRLLNEQLSWIPFQLSASRLWPQAPGDQRLGPLTGVPGCRKAFLGRKVNDPDEAVFVIVWESSTHYEQFLHSDKAAELSGNLGIDDSLPPTLSNSSNSYIDSSLRGRVTVAVADISCDEQEYLNTKKIKHVFGLAFDGYVSSGCAGIGRPPSPSRLSLACSGGQQRGARFYCFFRWGTSAPLCQREAASAQSDAAELLFSSTLRRGVPACSSIALERWHFSQQVGHEDEDEDEEYGENEDEEEIDPMRLAGRITRPGAVNMHDRLLRFNTFLAETFSSQTAALQLAADDGRGAAAEALSLPEILAGILIHLPQRDLLLYQIVSRTWHSVISSTQEIQEKLFFRPRSAATWKTKYGEFNPLLYERFPSFFTDCWDTGLGGWTDSHWHRTNRWHNRLLDSPYRRPGASWRKMIMCNPAPTEYQFVYYFTTWGNYSDWRLKTVGKDHTLPAGTNPFLTFGCLHDITERIWYQRQYFPRPNRLNVDYGPLTEAYDHVEDESGRELARFSRHFVHKVEQQFPGVTFDAAGKVLIELGYGQGCVMGSYEPDNSRPAEFRVESLGEPEFMIELGAGTETR